MPSGQWGWYIIELAVQTVTILYALRAMGVIYY
jgi:hypothetical protein